MFFNRVHCCGPSYAWGPPAYSYYNSMWGAGNMMLGAPCYPDPYMGSFYGGMQGSLVGSGVGGLLGFGLGMLTGNPFEAWMGESLGASLGGTAGWMWGSARGGGYW